MNKKIIIAIDGFAGSGKSTTARLVAKELGYIYIDTGAMYRAVTLLWIRSNTELTPDNICPLVNNINLELLQGNEGQIVLLNGEDVTQFIRTPEVSSYVSPVSALECVRKKMVEQQRLIGKNGGVVMDGRDIGTYVFPEANLKIFLNASVEVRAKRRQKELLEKQIIEPLENLVKNIMERDDYDSNREISPLRKADDAIEIDTTNITIEEQCSIITNLAKKLITTSNISHS